MAFRQRVALPLIQQLRCQLTPRLPAPSLPHSSADGAPATSTSPVAASRLAGDKSNCPYPALYAVFTLPNICSDRAFERARAKFAAALNALAGPGATHTQVVQPGQSGLVAAHVVHFS